MRVAAREFLAPRRRAVADKARHDRQLQPRDVERIGQQPSELAKVRDAETWNVISQSRHLNFLTSTQKTWLESMLVPVEFTEAGAIYPDGTAPQYFYIIRSGEVDVIAKGSVVGVLSRGDVIIHSDLLHTGREDIAYGFSNRGSASLYAVSRDDALRFFDRNPGVKMKLQYEF